MTIGTYNLLIYNNIFVLTVYIALIAQSLDDPVYSLYLPYRD